MALGIDDIRKINDIARQIAKEEIEAMDTALVETKITKLSIVVTDLETGIKALEAKTTNLETEMKDLKSEINRAKEVKPTITDQPKKYK